MDERYDLMRSARDKRYVYIRNYNPHKIYGQHVTYMWSLPSTPVWERLYNEGKLKPPQTYFWETKPPEELYDLQSRPRRGEQPCRRPPRTRRRWSAFGRRTTSTSWR